MANRIMYDLQCLNRDIVVMAGSFAPNGSSAVSAASNKGFGWSVARSGAGTFTITLQDSYQYLLAAQANLQLASADDKMCVIGSSDVASAKTVVIFVQDVSDNSATDVAADANNRINFVLYLANSSQTPVRGL